MVVVVAVAVAGAVVAAEATAAVVAFGSVAVRSSERLRSYCKRCRVPILSPSPADPTGPSLLPLVLVVVLVTAAGGQQPSPPAELWSPWSPPVDHQPDSLSRGPLEHAVVVRPAAVGPDERQSQSAEREFRQ